MHELWSSTSYEPHLLSLPFSLAPAAILIVIAYSAVMRGAPTLRFWLLAHSLCLLPYAVVMMLSPSMTSPAAAEQLFRLAAATIPMASATGSAFQLALLRKYRRYRFFVWFLVANAAIWIAISSTTNAVIDGVRPLAGFWYGKAGRWAWLGVIHTILITAPGFIALGAAALRNPPSVERRQLRAALIANIVTYSGLTDVTLAYGVGVFPLGWFLSGVGSLLVVRALVVEDILRVRAVDNSAPLLVMYFAAGTLLAWLSLSLLGGDLPWWLTTLVVVLCFLAVRVSIATIGLVNRGARAGEGPLERLLAQLVSRARTMTSPPAIAQLAVDIVELGIGAKTQVLLASEADWGWTTATGTRLADELAPDPLLAGWLAEQTGAVFADEPDAVPPDLRDLLARLFTSYDARVLVPIRSADELLGLVVVPTAARRLRGPAIGFVERVADRLAEALLHARLASKAAERAALAREVALAATVQAELLPGTAPHVIGDITVVGSWQPATRCAGDFWGVYPLGGGRALVAIGDVTGHGVASAMVTAAAVGACDVCVRRSGDQLDLTELVGALDVAVRRVGGGELAMTCFAAILDPEAHDIRFVSCGHTAPYLCRPTDKGIELQALVARGNPLGAGVPAVPRVQQRPLQPRDLVVWYTDGVIEAQNLAGAPFGDRRLQHLLRKLDPATLSPVAVHGLVFAGVAAHRAGQPPADDETLVVAQLAGAP